jgi:membrane-associated phospholipid phosphatase
MTPKSNLNLITNKLDILVDNNFKALGIKTILFPFFVLVFVFLFLLFKGGLSIKNYTLLQEKCFLMINERISEYYDIQQNLTQLGDVIVFLPFLTIFIIYAPKLWQYLLTSLVFSAIVSNILKILFAVPRPAAIFDNERFAIIGEKLSGNTSLPSGHSIATFTVLTLVFFAFSPKKKSLQRLWFLFIFISGIIIVCTRIGVGAHYPLDVVIGGAIGSAVSIFGILFCRKFNAWFWVGDIKYYPIFIFIFCIWGFALINKIIMLGLIIFYLSLFSLLISLLIFANIYVKK